MKTYTPSEKVQAARITALNLMNNDRPSEGWEITLDDGSQVYETYANFQHARAGDVYLRPLASSVNPLPCGYHLPATYFEAMFREAIPALKHNRVPEERIEAMLRTLEVQCQRFPGTTTTIALAALPGGFVVAQGMNACVDPRNFDANLGVKYATENALRKARAKLWDYEGYFLMRMREQSERG
jgi:hypothetical protein